MSAPTHDKLDRDMIESKIVKTEYLHVGPMMTICALTLENGFIVTGESAPVSIANFDAEVGARIARDNAVAKIWPLEGYLLKQRLHEAAGE